MICGKTAQPRRAGSYPPWSEDSEQEIGNMDFFLLQMKGGEKDRDGERNGVSRENATCPNGKEQYQ